MSHLEDLNISELAELKLALEERYHDFQSRNLQLDMTRGKPCAEQLDLSLGMLELVGKNSYAASGGIDCRNYGGLDGIPEAKELFAKFMEVETEEIIVAGNASLKLMHDTIVGAMLQGVSEGMVPWAKLPKVKFLCPSPGYDRHFGICEYLGLEMIPVAMTEHGPDMDVVEGLVGEDESIKGIWCVPRYSNPTGIVYSDDTVDRLAGMTTKAVDFRIFWDNCYAVHHLVDGPVGLKSILTACKEAGSPDRVFLYGSTSKITFAGAGVAMMAGSARNMAPMVKQMSFQTIGHDKLNQLRHVLFLKDMEGIAEHMAKHAAILRPKFDAVQEVLARELGDSGVVEWSRPTGGYFVSIDTLDGCAESVVAMAAEAGVKLTPAGATYPYGRDPRDRNIRIAPTFPPLADVVSAMELTAICIKLASIDRLAKG